MKNIDRLKITFNKKTVGYLEAINNQIAFEYDDEWLISGFCISPFFLPLKKQTFYSNPNKFNGLFGVFNDSLPDGWGILITIRELAKNHIDYEKLSPLTKLSIIGSNGLGGFEYEPCQNSNMSSIDKFDLDKLSLDIKTILNDDYDNKTLDQIYELGGSSGGARPKAHIKINNEEWIIKFPTHLDKSEFGIDEFNANNKAKQCDINVNEFKLFKSNLYKGYFGVKRFDRNLDKKYHVISLSGLLEVSHRDNNLDYSILFKVIENISCRVRQDKIEAYKRMCFNVLFGNKDDHSKNWSFIYDEKLKGYILSPFYDITKTPHLQYRSMLVFDKENPTEQDLLVDAKKIGIDAKTALSIINKIKEVIFKNN